MDHIIQVADQYFESAHKSIGQVRKYSGEPYFNHCRAVAALIRDHALVYTTDCIVAALGHDSEEDVYPLNKEYSLDRTKHIFGVYVHQLIVECTNVYTKERFPYINRDKRNNLEANRLAWVSSEAQTIKYADIINNCSDLKVQDPKYASKYLDEKKGVLRLMNKGDSNLYELARKVVGL